jgi:hypothetical protein
LTDAVDDIIVAGGLELMGRNKPRKKTRKTSQKGNILTEMDPNTALDILRRLSNDSVDLKVKIKKTALEMMKGVDVEEVASDVFSCLDSLQVEDVWGHSGGTRDGYVDPAEYAFEMFESELEPFLTKMRRYQKLSMHEEARNYCMGILLGIHKFEKEATTEFSDWVTDVPNDFFSDVLDEWNNKCKIKKDIKIANSFAMENFKEWWSDWKRHQSHKIVL